MNKNLQNSTKVSIEIICKINSTKICDLALMGPPFQHTLLAFLDSAYSGKKQKLPFTVTKLYIYVRSPNT